ncbi:hypothetical protein BJ875DRAFT_485037 [Amylocarpus encephaloides]|uniref:Uncharacterized protein n=1 Tax=Amylocarpus encephaloides TaxID=45428 RepID=A0A9P7YH23_9HELO|nr:hypothetical protein BJ875DRAFT_485037 [Amylocarpus encephaloides]
MLVSPKTVSSTASSPSKTRRQGQNMEPELKVLCIKVHNAMYVKLNIVQNWFLDPRSKGNEELKTLMDNLAEGITRKIAELVRMVHDCIPQYRRGFKPLLENRLQLNCGKSGEGAGLPGSFEEYFLFETVEECDLPWKEEDGWRGVDEECYHLLRRAIGDIGLRGCEERNRLICERSQDTGSLLSECVFTCRSYTGYLILVAAMALLGNRK